MGLTARLHKDRKPVAAALKGVYRALDADAGAAALTTFDRANGAGNTPPSSRVGGAPGPR
jgi:hypothetical protein